MWLLFAVLAPLFFAVVHVLDEYCVDHVLEKPWMGVVTSSIASCVLFVGLPFLYPWIDPTNFSLSIFLLAIIAGFLIQVSQAFYFHALSFSDAGIVSAHWNLIPFLLPIAGFFLFGEIFTTQQYLGIVILIVSSTCICLLDFHHKTRSLTFVLMILAAIFQVVAYLIMGKIYHQADFILIFFSITLGIVFTGFSVLLFRNPRKRFIKALPRILPVTKFFIAIEVANLLALACAHIAISMGDAALVAAVETTVPAFVFIISMYWVKRMQVFSEAIWSHLPIKLLVVGFMAFGVWLVS